MTFEPCIIIPCYNHGKTIAGVLDRISRFNLPVILIDDGSNEDTKSLLKSVSQRKGLVVHTLKMNQGKGAAMARGFQLASEAGYSHALQVDADAQHNIEDIPIFLNEAKAYPERVIAGYPIFDDSVPKGRLYGRYITKAWVWLETLSMQVRDSMCGYRLYPVEPTAQLLKKTAICKRMGYDTDIAVRLSWKGMKFRNVPTRVTYPEDGTSHFDMLKDNIEISCMHARLFAGMLWRFPRILFLKLRSDPKQQDIENWSSSEEAGTYFLIKLLLSVYKWLGRPILRAILPLVILFYFVFHRNARRASRLYLNQLNDFEKQRGRQTIKPNGTNIYRHLYAFGQMMLMKISAWLRKPDRKDIILKNPKTLDQLVSFLNSGQGAVLIASHLGNVEMLHAFANLKLGMRINGLTYTEHSKVFNRVLHEINPASGLNLIQIGKIDIGTSIRLKNRVDDGELVVITADRVMKEKSTVKCDFLGSPASFPTGPFILASILECPVFFIFCVQNGRKYDFFITKESDNLKFQRAKRKEQLQEVIQGYAKLMEDTCCDYPLQWFNFFNFWQ